MGTPSRGRASSAPIPPPCALDALEPRRLLSSISGSVWHDHNGDRLRSPDESPSPDITVFIDKNFNARLDPKEPRTLTDAQGQYTFPLPPGRYVLGMIPPAGAQQTSPAPTSQFDIDLAPARNVTPEKLAVIRSAADRWEQVIVGDLPAARGIDDIVLKLETPSIDGPDETLAFAFPSAFRRKGTQLPYRATLRFDADDLAPMPDEELFTLAVHEIGHALGFGTLWEDKGLILGAGRRKPRFVGKRALEVYSRLTNNPSIETVPVESHFGPGTRDSHWPTTDPLLGEEVMNGFIEGTAPLSAVTVASMEDLGYAVDLSAADPMDGATPTLPLTVTPPGALSSFYDVSIADDESPVLDFAHTPFATIEGAVLLDRNRNRRIDPPDPRLTARRVFLDLDSDGRRDAAEPSVLTDAKGRYAFQHLPPGLYAITLERDPKSPRVPSDTHELLVYLGDLALTVDFLTRP